MSGLRQENTDQRSDSNFGLPELESKLVLEISQLCTKKKPQKRKKEKKMKCPLCHGSTPDDTRFCIECGRDLGWRRFIYSPLYRKYLGIFFVGFVLGHVFCRLKRG